MSKDLEIRVHKVNEHGVVFGYGFVCKEKGVPYKDLHGDKIREDAMLKSAIEYMEGGRVAKEMHKGDAIGQVIFAYPITDEICEALEMTAEKTGLVIGMKPNAEVLGKFKDGTYKAFSLGGLLTRIEKNIEEMEKMAKKGMGGKKPKKPMKKEYDVVDMTLLEFSAVDFPAQEGAVAAIIKSMGTETLKVRLTNEKPTEKAGTIAQMVTSEEDGHVHGLSIYCSCDEIRVYLDYANTEGGVNHSHALQKTEKGLMVHMDAGHSHTIDADAFMAAVSEVLEVKSTEILEDETETGAKETSMTEDELKALQESQIATAHKAHFDSLDGEARDAFLGATNAERDEAIAKAEAAKAEDPREAEIKALREQVEANNAALVDMEIEKRAESFKGLGTLDFRKAVIKFVDSLEGDIREQAETFFGNAVSDRGAAFKSFGSAVPTEDEAETADEANAKMDELAKARASEKGISYVDAHVQVQDENPELVAKARQRTVS